MEADYGGPVDAGRGIRWWMPTQQPRSGGGRKRESTWLVDANTSLLVHNSGSWYGSPVEAGSRHTVVEATAATDPNRELAALVEANDSCRTGGKGHPRRQLITPIIIGNSRRWWKPTRAIRISINQHRGPRRGTGRIIVSN